MVSKRVLVFDLLRFENLIKDIFDLKRLSLVKFGLERVIKIQLVRKFDKNF